MRSEGIYGIYRRFGLTTLIQSPASALWWGTYGAAQSLGYRDDIEKKPSSVEMVSVQASAGLVVGALSSVVTTPIDTVKTRLQVMDNYGDGRPSITKTAMTPLAYFYSPNFPLKL
ncbi:Solute carrier family 25 member 44 [Bienertia sinuspersici]